MSTVTVSTGLVYPTTMIVVGTPTWNNPNNAKTPGGGAADITPIMGDTSSGTLQGSVFDFGSIPAGSPIVKVEATVVVRADNLSSAQDDIAYLIDGGVPIGGNAALNAWWSDSFVAHVFTFTTSLPTLAQIKSSSFGLAFRGYAVLATNMYVDSMALNVYYSAEVVIDAPPGTKNSPLMRRIETPDYSDWYYYNRLGFTRRNPEIYTITNLQQPPPLRKKEQRSLTFEEGLPHNVWWRQARPSLSTFAEVLKGDVPIPRKVPNTPHIHVLPDFNYAFCQVRSHWPVPVEGIFVPDPVPPSRTQRASTQRVYELPDLESYYVNIRMMDKIRHRLPIPPVNLFRSTVGFNGYSGILAHFDGIAYKGKGRVGNAEGYVVWIGENALPDITTTPTMFSPTVPFEVPITPPLVGQTTFYVIVRRRNAFGLQSQNQRAFIIIVDSDGNRVLPPIGIPKNVTFQAVPGVNIGIRATYPHVDIDEFPANEWFFWINNTVPPVPGVDTKSKTTLVNGPTILANFMDYSPGTYYLAVALHRTLDNKLSPAVSGVVTIPAVPGEVGSVHGGFELNEGVWGVSF